MTRPAEEARLRAKRVREEALARAQEREGAALTSMAKDLAALRTLLEEQAGKLEELAGAVDGLARRLDVATSEELPLACPRPLTTRKRQILERIRDLRGQGLSFARICQVFQEEQVPTLSGEGQWSKGTLWNLWKNHARQLESRG